MHEEAVAQKPASAIGVERLVKEHSTAVLIRPPLKRGAASIHRIVLPAIIVRAGTVMLHVMKQWKSRGR